ncbi:hypothetical protein DPX16_14689 [Anabarilius grahami]|uniref:Uncharacterized protein n=1 Tax=Anabarilius grahami TaxID=495550 RepID=A0A3N0XNY9_ANAGA|nr:hypothetical protein DPX16_14689 [Anabarilius grahami]
MDADFKEFMNLTSVSEIEHKSTLKVIYMPALSPVELQIDEPCITLYPVNSFLFCVFVQATEDAENENANTVMGIYTIRRGDSTGTEDIGVVIEGIKVLSNLDCVILAFIMLIGLIYALDLSFPDNLKYTFEFIQKILMNLDGHKLNAKIQQLKIKLFA